MKYIVQFIFILTILFTTFSCNQNREKPGGYQGGDQKQSNRNNGFNDLVADYESKDRLIWQKPDMVITRLGDLSTQTVVDLGAGTGFFAFRMVNQAKKVIALDIDRRFITFMAHLQAWIARMADPAAPPPGPGWLPGDAIAPTLDAVMRLLFKSFVPMLDGINRQVQALLPGLPAGQPLPRALADVEMPMGDGVFRRAAIPYTLWMAQRTLDLLAAMPADDQRQVRDWLARVGGDGLLSLQLARLRRVGLRVAPASA